MLTKTREKAEELKKDIAPDEIRRMNYRVSDAIREGSTVTDQAQGNWGDGENACALHAGIIAATARGYIKS